MNNHEAMIALAQIPGLGSVHLKTLLHHFNYQPCKIWETGISSLASIPGLGNRWFLQLNQIDWAAATAEYTKVLNQNITLYHYHEAGYPRLLLPLHNPPSLLYIAGKILPQDEQAIAIVGTRHPTSYGIREAYRLAKTCARLGITVVSGLARGIDLAAHQGALAGGGRTIAVLGNGLTKIYPPEHTALADKIKLQGALVSEFAMDAPPAAYHFPQRNRIISGLSLGIIVVEGGKDSGAIITADCALDQGREVFAVPGELGHAQSEGPNFLIQQGAKLITGLEDVLAELSGWQETTIDRQPGATIAEQLPESTPEPATADSAPSSPSSPSSPAESAQPMSTMNTEEQLVWQNLSSQPEYMEVIARNTALSPIKVSCCLLQMELRGLVKKFPGQRYVRK